MVRCSILQVCWVPARSAVRSRISTRRFGVDFASPRFLHPTGMLTAHPGWPVIHLVWDFAPKCGKTQLRGVKTQLRGLKLSSEASKLSSEASKLSCEASNSAPRCQNSAARPQNSAPRIWRHKLTIRHQKLRTWHHKLSIRPSGQLVVAGVAAYMVAERAVNLVKWFFE